MKHTLKLRCAPLAIAAFAALGTTPGYAQETSPAPVIILPDEIGNSPPVTTSASAPTQDESVAPIAIEPVVIPETASTNEASSSDRAPAGSPATMSARTESQPDRAANAIATPGNDPVQNSGAIDESMAATETAASAEIEPLQTSASIEPQPLPAADGVQTAPVGASLSDEALFAGLGILAAIGGIGAFATRRRRKTVRKSADALANERPVERPVGVRRDEPAPVSVPLIEREPRVGTFDSPTASTASSGDAFGGLPNEGAAVALPRAVPENFDERDALFRRMIAARPDRANPFRSPLARAKRAKLILQSLSRKFESRKPRIDLSQYTSNWPALRGWQPTTA